MKKTLLIVAALTLSFFTARGQQPLIDQLVANINAMTLQEKVETRQLAEEFIDISDRGRYNDVMILQLYLEVNLPDEEVAVFMQSQLPDGSWPDIDYKDNKRSRWAPANHATRIQALSKIYKTPRSKFYNSKELSAVIHKAMDFWFGAGLVCPNWWYNEIGVPRLLGPAFLLLKDELSATEKEHADKVLSKAGFRMTGQNKVWLAGSMFIKGLLLNDLPLALQARDTIVSEIFMSTAEGLQPDYSFHQHGPQMQLGNYGLAYIGTLSYWARVLSWTPMALDDRQLGLLRGYFIEAMQWTVWCGYMDVNASARQVFMNSQKGKAHSLAVAAVNMIEVDPAYARVYKSFIYRNQLNPAAVNDLTGNKYFWRSDYAIQRTPTWYTSVRMHSDRTIPFEMTNRENLQGVYSADGVMITMVDGNEYENIYPMWDWKHLPGLTAIDKDQPIAYYHPNKPINRSAFTGGVSDSQKGIAAMILDRDGIRAHKAYFFTDEIVVCLGAGISTDPPAQVSTTLEQNLLRGAVTYGTGEKEIKVGDGKEIAAEGINWIHSGKTGYVLLDPAHVTISTKVQSGSWGSIADFYTADQTASAPVFKASIFHGTGVSNGSYAYCVLPGRNLKEVDWFSREHSERMTYVNSTDYQGVFYTDKQLWQVVFYTAGELKIGKNRLLSVDAPCIVMIENTAEGLVAYVADPTQKLDRVTLGIEILNYEKSASTVPATSYLYTKTIELPTEAGRRGSTVRILLNK